MDSRPGTKVFPPPLRQDVFQRPDLLDRLRAELPSSRLVLICAPAGYGKTTLLSFLPRVFPEYLIAWFALDPEDSDPARFLHGLSQAISTCLPEFRSTTEGLFLSSGIAGETIPLRQFFIQLINLSVNLPAPLILVLDDLHFASAQAINDGINYLLDHLPANIHLAVTTRHRPPLRLNRMRARRQLAEFTQQDLSFNLAESTTLLNNLLKRKLDSSQIADLQRRSEGWPVGLILMTNQLKRQSISAQDEFIDQSTFDYLAEEVLAEQPRKLQTFLLETSILDELTPSSCAQVTGTNDSALLLEEIHRRNLFLTPVRFPEPGQEPVYRYHSLFSEFLKRVLRLAQPQRWKALHRRAADLAQEPQRMIQHLILAEEWNGAADLLERIGEEYLQQGLQETVAGWMDSLPPSSVTRRPHLLYLQGYSHFFRGDLEIAQTRLEQSFSLLNDPHPELETPPHGERDRVLVGLATLEFVQARFERCKECIEQVDSSLSDPQVRLNFLVLRASLDLFCYANWARAGQDLREAIALVLASDDSRLWYQFSLYLAPEFTVLPGAFDLLETFCSAARERVPAQISPLRLGVEDTWSGILIRRGKFFQAMETARKALFIQEQLGGYMFLGVNAALAIATVSVTQENYDTAGRYFSHVLSLVEKLPLNRALIGGGLYPLGRMYCIQGRYAEARSVIQQMNEITPKLPHVDVLQKMLAALLEMNEKNYPAAEMHLLDALRLQNKAWVTEIYGSPRLLLAYLYDCWGKPNEALRELDTLLAGVEAAHIPGLVLQELPLVAPVLRLAVTKGVVRARQAEQLLDQMGLSRGKPEPVVPALLTERQVKILQLIAAGNSNQAIAQQLQISLATVKSHIVHIMDRLGASSRTEAVAIARQIGILTR
jgi:LuxR family transcriptional regulator, maltose regulon positive regulatory protein